MNEDEIMTTTEIVEDCAVNDVVNHTGLKTLGAVTLTSAIGVGLFFGVKKLVKKIKNRKKNKYITHDESDEVAYETDDE